MHVPPVGRRFLRSAPPSSPIAEEGCHDTFSDCERIEQFERDNSSPSREGARQIRSDGWYGDRPQSWMVLEASLAACCSTVIAAQAARLRINLTKLEVTVEGEGDIRGMLGLDNRVSAGHSTIRSNVKIGAANATSEQLQELVEWAVDHSPVCRTVRDAPMNALNVVIV